MSMAPVAAAISENSSGATKSKIQSIAWPGPAMKPSSDIDLFTTTLPFPVLISLIVFLRRTLDVPAIRSGAFWARRSTATAASTEDTSPPTTVIGLSAAPERTATVTATSATNGCQRRSATAQDARDTGPAPGACCAAGQIASERAVPAHQEDQIAAAINGHQPGGPAVDVNRPGGRFTY